MKTFLAILGVIFLVCAGSLIIMLLADWRQINIIQWALLTVAALCFGFAGMIYEHFFK
jgi:hypothetical protein